MHVLVTGATGFVGFHTARALMAAGHDVRLGVRSVEKMRRVFGPHGLDTSDHAVGEITDREAIERALDGCDAVVHTAAVVELDTRRADYVRKTNVRGTELVLEGAVAREMESIVYVSSTTALYDRRARRLTEASPLGNVEDGYGRSKVDSERIAKRLTRRGAPIAITYPATILGPDDPGMSEGSQGIAYFLNYGMVVTTTGMQIVDVRDVAEAHLRLVEGRRTGRFIVAGTFISWSELADLLDRVTGKQLPRYPTPRFAARMLGRLMDGVTRYLRVESPFTLESVTYATEWVVADNTKAERELGLHFRPLEETLVDSIRWLAEMRKVDPSWAEDLSVGR